MESVLQIRWMGKRILTLLGMLLIGAAAPLQAALQQTADGTPEPATFALIGGALCLVGLRLRGRKK